MSFTKVTDFNQIVTLDLKQFGDTYVLWSICSFTRFLQGVVLKDKSALSIIEAMNSSWNWRFGYPSVGFWADNGTEFQNKELEEFKAEKTGKPCDALEPWEVGFWSEKLKKERESQAANNRNAGNRLVSRFGTGVAFAAPMLAGQASTLFQAAGGSAAGAAGINALGTGLGTAHMVYNKQYNKHQYATQQGANAFDASIFRSYVSSGTSSLNIEQDASDPSKVYISVAGVGSVTFTLS